MILLLFLFSVPIVSLLLVSTEFRPLPVPKDQLLDIKSSNYVQDISEQPWKIHRYLLVLQPVHTWSVSIPS